jgi:hypothetical protein
MNEGSFNLAPARRAEGLRAGFLDLVVVLMRENCGALMWVGKNGQRTKGRNGAQRRQSSDPEGTAPGSEPG